MYIAGQHHHKSIFKFINPTQTIVIGFFIIICIGTLLLSLPIASNDGLSVSFEDAFFTASSAVCVTGLVTLNTLEHWTVFGQIVIILLIQVGGLGFMTIVTMILVLARKKITMKERILIQESLNQESMQGMVKLVKRIFIGTIVFESTGAVLLTSRFLASGYSFGRSIYMGIFHSISAFCNAGFDIIGDANLTPYVGDITVNVVIMSLIVIGGLGFTVWMDIMRVYRKRRDNRFSLKTSFRKLTLHSKLVLTITLFLILSGAVFFFFCEYSNVETLKNLTMKEKILAAFMQSVSPRTAGFNSISQSGLTYASKFMTIILMFIGGSPSGTAGGIKTVTLGVLAAAVISVIRGRDTTNAYRKNIPFMVLQKALSIFLISFIILIGVTMFLTFSEKNTGYEYEFIDLLFETASALGTVGLTTGITPYLSTAGKIVIAFTMYLGRIGPISIAVALASKQNSSKTDIQFPEERVMVG